MWQSWPQACITPTSSPFQMVRTLEANGTSTSSLTGSASMSARRATTLPGSLPFSTPITPVCATPVRTSSRPRLFRCSATILAVRFSRLPSSGLACKSRRHSMTCASTACAALSMRSASSLARSAVSVFMDENGNTSPASGRNRRPASRAAAVASCSLRCGAGCRRRRVDRVGPDRDVGRRHRALPGQARVFIAVLHHVGQVLLARQQRAGALHASGGGGSWVSVRSRCISSSISQRGINVRSPG